MITSWKSRQKTMYWEIETELWIETTQQTRRHVPWMRRSEMVPHWILGYPIDIFEFMEGFTSYTEVKVTSCVKFKLQQNEVLRYLLPEKWILVGESVVESIGL